MSFTPRNDIQLNIAWNLWYEELLQKFGNDEVQTGRFINLYPSVMWVPNFAQERPISLYRSPPYPRIAFITFGNGTGKTDFLGEFLTGVVKGKEWVNPVFCNCDFFDELIEKRDKETLTVWWVCDSDLMKSNAPDYKAIKAHMPDAIFKGRDNKLVFHEIHIPFVKKDGQPGKITIQVKTHGQATSSFAGENIDLIICDEPPPEVHWAEIVGRIRSKKGEAGARIVIGGTPLEISGYLFDYLDDPEFKDIMVQVTGALWENCVPEELPEKEAEKLGIPKDENGVYITRGHLTRESIEHQILLWSKSKDPLEVRARTYGEGSHVLGRIYKSFSREKHVTVPFDIPKEWPILFYVDPHDARDDVGVWFTVTPLNKLVAVAEYPDVPYEQLWERRYNIAETCDEWIKIQNLFFNRWPTACFGDPNKMETPDSITKRRLKHAYSKYGFHFSTNITDNLAIGHDAVRKMLWCDEARMEQFPGDPLYQPQLQIFESCPNCINFMLKYSTLLPKDLSKVFTEGVDKKFKDFPDIIRYAVITFKSFSYWRERMSTKNNEWADIQKARGGSTRNSEQGIFKNRHIIPGNVFV